jgi:hypothetical protein
MPILPILIHTHVQHGMQGLGVTNVTPTPAMIQLAQAIQTQEGYYPGSLAYQNNNPGNLVYAGQPGASPGAGGFAAFDTYEDGLQALYNQLNLYANGTCGACGGQPLTIAQMTAIYAPAGQGSNNPTAYANNISAAVGADPNTQLSDLFNGTPSSTPASTDVLNPASGGAVDWGMLAMVAGGAMLLLFAFQGRAN